MTTIIIEGPAATQARDGLMRVWVASCAPENRYRPYVDAVRLDLAPPADVLAQRARGELSDDAFISAYERALDALPDAAFVVPLTNALGKGLVLVTGDRLSGFVLRRYVIDWAARNASMEKRMERAARHTLSRLLSSSVKNPNEDSRSPQTKVWIDRSARMCGVHPSWRRASWLIGRSS